MVEPYRDARWNSKKGRSAAVRKLLALYKRRVKFNKKLGPAGREVVFTLLHECESLAKTIFKFPAQFEQLNTGLDADFWLVLTLVSYTMRKLNMKCFTL